MCSQKYGLIWTEFGLAMIWSLRWLVCPPAIISFNVWSFLVRALAVMELTENEIEKLAVTATLLVCELFHYLHLIVIFSKISLYQVTVVRDMLLPTAHFDLLYGTMNITMKTARPTRMASMAPNNRWNIMTLKRRPAQPHY